MKLIKFIKDYQVIIAAIIAVLLYFGKLHSLPNRVVKLEKEVSELKKSILSIDKSLIHIPEIDEKVSKIYNHYLEKGLGE